MPHIPEHQFQTEEQRQAALAASGLTSQQQQGVISTPSLTPVSSPAYKDPETPAITTPKPEDFTPAAPTSQEQGISDLIGTITKEQTSLPGEKSAFQAEETKRLGLETLAKEESDLFSQLKMQQAEFENLQTEDVRIKERLQQESIGRGRTAGGLAPLEAAELRKNFLIKSEKAAQVNVTAAILAGTQNKLLTAQTLIDRAVANKYGARDADLKAKIDNLDLLLKDPTLTVEQANRAQKQLEIQNKKKEDEAKKKADATKILEWAVEARRGGMDVITAQKVANIGLSENPDLAGAFELVAPFIQEKQQKLDTQITEVNGRKVLINVQTGATIKDLGTAKVSKPESEVIFTDTQTAKGAAVAETSIADFKKLDQDTQNFFINNSAIIAAKKKIIDEAKETKQDPASLKQEIQSAIMPEIAKDLLNKYIDSIFPKQEEQSLPFWKRAINYISSFF